MRSAEQKSMAFVHHSDPDSLAGAGVLISDVAGKGKGLFAVRNLCANALICAERSILDTFGISGRFTDVRRLEDTFRQLSTSDQDAVMALHDCTCTEQSDQKSIVGIYSTNAFACRHPTQTPVLPFARTKQGGICPVLSRANHSCMPNCVYTYHAESDHFALVTCRHIRAGEEICVDYIGSAGMARATRQAELLRAYSFACKCSACCPVSRAAGVQSDENRQALGLLEAELAEAGRVHPDQFKDKVRRLLSLYKKEGILNPAVNGRLHHELVETFLMLPDTTLEEIQESAQTCSTSYRLVHGQHSASMKKVAKYVERSRTEETLQMWRIQFFAYQVFGLMGVPSVVMCSITALYGPFSWFYLALGIALLFFAGQYHFAVPLAMFGWLAWPSSGVALSSSILIWFGVPNLYSYFSSR